MEELRKKIKEFLWDYTHGHYNTESLNLEEQMDFKAEKILDLIKEEYAKLVKDQELPGWDNYIWPTTTQSKEEMSRYQTGGITKEQHEQERRILHDEELAIYKKAQQDMLKAGFKKVT